MESAFFKLLFVFIVIIFKLVNYPLNSNSDPEQLNLKCAGNYSYLQGQSTINEDCDSEALLRPGPHVSGYF